MVTLRNGISPVNMSRDARVTIGILLIGSVVVVLNETIMVVALPHVMDDLGITAGAGQWLTTAYMITMAVFIPASSFALQRLSTRDVFLLELGLFCIGTLIAGIAPDFWTLLAARVIQAIGAAISGPLLMSTVLSLAPLARRGRTLGTVTIVISVAPVIGPVVSGLVLQFLSWRSIFLIELPFALGILILGALRLKNVTSSQPVRADFLSFALTVPAFGLLVYGLSQLGESQGATGRLAGAFALIVGLVSLACFAGRQIQLQKVGTPLLDLRVLRHAAYHSSVLVLLLAMCVNFGLLLTASLYFQHVRGFSPFEAGLVMLGGGVLSGVMGRVSGRLCEKYQSRSLMLIGTGILTVSTGSFALADTNTPMWILALMYAALMGGGMGFIATPAITNATAPLPPTMYSHGIAFLSTFQQVAGAAGAALLISISAWAGGGAEAAGSADGLRASFLAATIIGLSSFVAALFVKTPLSVNTVENKPVTVPGQLDGSRSRRDI
jgi:DHA2 family lincomycin resistance protein-like MFS transporter